VTHDRRFITREDLVLEIQDGQLAGDPEAETVDYTAALNGHHSFGPIPLPKDDTTWRRVSTS
jgi:hypothetical protein